MNVRTTNQAQIGQALANIRLQSGAITKYQSQLSSGSKVTRPSDNPSAFAQIFQDQSTADRYDGYLTTMTDATSTLDASVSNLQEGNQLLVRAKQIAQEGANGTTDSSASEALASELDGIITRMVGVANSQVNGQNLYGGTATTGQPFTVSGTDAAGRPAAVAYTGSDDQSRSLVGPNQTVDTRYAGRNIFQKPGSDAFQALIGLRDDLRNTSLSSQARADAISQRIGQVDAARDQIGTVIGQQSSTLANLDTMQSFATNLKLAGTTRAGDLQGTDYASATVNLQSQENLFQATLSVSARLIQPNLMDFLK